jgi:hypothetical protein
VKCPRCLTVCADEDDRCPACRAPLFDEPPALPPAAVGRRAARWGLVGLAVGAALGPVVGGGLPLVSPSPTGPNVNLILWACFGGGVGAVVGYVLGLARFRPRRAAAD